MSCYSATTAVSPHVSPVNTTDFSVPLHVDCSVEYELPACAKPPQGVKIEPLLMIHPCHFRNLERQRRRPFENNMPNNNITSNRNKRKTSPYTASWETYRRQTSSVINNNNNNNHNNNNNSSQIMPQPSFHEPYTCQTLAAWTWGEPLQHLQPTLPRYEAV